MPRQVATPWEVLLACVGFVTVFPIRCLAVVFSLVACAMLGAIATWGVSLKDVGVVPLSKWRRALLAANPALMRLFVFGLGVMRVKTTGVPAKFDDAPIIVSNHIGSIEGAYLLSKFRVRRRACRGRTG